LASSDTFFSFSVHARLSLSDTALTTLPPFSGQPPVSVDISFSADSLLCGDYNCLPMPDTPFIIFFPYSIISHISSIFHYFRYLHPLSHMLSRASFIHRFSHIE
jgi:hypothetical protein